MICQNCNNQVPHHRHGNSPYCSSECAYEVKRRMSYIHYHSKSDLYKVLERQEALLAKYHEMTLCGHDVTYHHLKNEDFNFGFALDECLGPNSEICKIIGEYAYYLNPKTKTISIWKLVFNPSQTV